MSKGVDRGKNSMGRPIKTNADYFKHFAKNGKTKRILFQRMGHVGKSCWWELLEILTDTDNHFLDVSADMEWLDLLAVLGVDEQTAHQFFSLLVRLGKIDQELWENDRIIWCQSLIDHGGIGALWLERGKNSPEKPKSRKKKPQLPLFPPENLVSPPENSINPGESAPSRAEQSRVYLRKAEETQNGNGAASLLNLPFENTFSALLFLFGEHEKSTRKGVRKQQQLKAQSLLDKFPDAFIDEKIRHFLWILKYRPELAGKNPAGYLIKSIEENWPPPSGYEEWREQETKRQRVREQAQISLGISQEELN